jgi:hypothetical protein
MIAEPSDNRFEIEPLEERIAPSAMSWGSGAVGGGEANQVTFLGIDPAPPYHGIDAASPS